MKYILSALISLFAVTGFSQDSGKAIVCNNAGTCWEVTQVRINGIWTSACCNNVTPFGVPPKSTCEDDCGNSSVSQPSPSLGFINYPSFENVPASFQTNQGNNVWVFKNGELSNSVYELNTTESQHINAMGDFTWFNSADGEYMAIKIDDITYAVVGNGTSSLQRKKNPDNHLDDFEGFEIYPNPIKIGEVLRISSVEYASSLVVINTQGIIVQEFFFSNGNKIDLFRLNENISKGVYVVQVNYFSGARETQKLVVLD